MRAKVFLLALGCLDVFQARAQKDTLPARPSAESAKHQLRVGFDLSKPVLNVLLDTRKSYELSVDYYLGKELYGVVEGGWGRAKQEYEDLSYTSRNAFFRTGIDKSLLVRLAPSDWDMASIGVRYAYAPVHRSEATFTTRDTVWGSTSGTVPAVNRGVQWVEIVGGMRVEILPKIQVGWNIRGRFLLSQSAFTDLRPSFIAGYGQGDKNTVFDFNVWAVYALRW